MTNPPVAGADLRALDVGFMPLLDAAPLVAAVRLGLDRRQGLHLRLHRQASWAAVRDRLLSGELDATHAMSAMVLGVQTGIGGPRADLAILTGLNRNGQAIVLSGALADALEQATAAGQSLGAVLRTLPRRPVFAQTFPTGTHAVWLYRWLALQGVEPMRDIEAVSLPPSTMPQALADGVLDGFCAGEPWGEQVEVLGIGRRVVRTGELWPGHPEKVLACRRDFVELEPGVVVALTTAVLDACRWLDADPLHRLQAAEWLAEPDCIGLPAERLAACLLPRAGEPPGQCLQFHAGGLANAPSLAEGRWFLGQFRRWGWLPPAAPAEDDAWLAEVYRLDSWLQAARALGIVLPSESAGVGEA